MRLTATRVTKLVLIPIMIGSEEPTPQRPMAITEAIALRGIEASVPAALARFQKKPVKTGTKSDPDSKVYAMSSALTTSCTQRAMNRPGFSGDCFS